MARHSRQSGVPKNRSKFACCALSGWARNRLISSYMKLTRTSQFGAAKIVFTISNGTAQPKGSMKAKVGGSLPSEQLQ